MCCSCLIFSFSLTEESFSILSMQFLCLKNIRTFLAACSEVFGMKKSELFDAFDLFDVRNFGKVGKAKAQQPYDDSALCYFLLLSCADSLHPPSLSMPAVPKDCTELSKCALTPTFHVEVNKSETLLKRKKGFPLHSC